MMTLREASVLLGGAAVSGPAALRFVGVSTDSRTIAPGELFVALKGENFDAHTFAARALERGAVAALVSEPIDVTLPTLTVADTRHALGELARGWRERFAVPLIAVTGSNGKTTTKEMIAAILAAAFGEGQRLATRGNLNNDVGLPMTLLRLRSSHRAVVVELGMNHPGETRWLADVARPTICVVTNAQREHQEFMHGVTEVAQEHALAIAALPPGTGSAVFPGDDAHSAMWRDVAQGQRILDFALIETRSSSGAAVRAVAHPGLFDTVVHLDTPAGPITAKLATAGLHNVRNAAAACAAALAAGIEPAAIRAGLEAFEPVRGRMARRQAVNGALLIDDSYNANPDSVRAAIDVLAQSAAPRLLILGDMGEVGANGRNFHEEIGNFAHARGIERFMATGPQMQAACTTFGAGATHFEDVTALTAAARDWLEHYGPSAAVLVKGSRFMGMERVVAALETGSDAPLLDRESH
jgi:UDP-N-acetylmuramoyl-tripeptide--D-alanyl-D-alanine ligase